MSEGSLENTLYEYSFNEDLKYEKAEQVAMFFSMAAFEFLKTQIQQQLNNI